jgi:hypothetical protein
MFTRLMLIFRSLGTSTIVALMAAHRTVSHASNDASPVFDQAAVDRMHQDFMAHVTTTEKHVFIKLSNGRCDEQPPLAE